MDSSDASRTSVRLRAKCPVTALDSPRGGIVPPNGRCDPGPPCRRQKRAAFHGRAQSHLRAPSLPHATASTVAPAANTAAASMVGRCPAAFVSSPPINDPTPMAPLNAATYHEEAASLSSGTACSTHV